LVTLIGIVSLLFDPVPDLPTPAGPHAVGSETYTWTDLTRDEAATSAVDDRQVVVQAWYPTSATSGPVEPYLGDPADGVVPVAGYPTWFSGRFDAVDTHAFHGTPVEDNASGWPVLLFSPGAGMGRQAYTSLSVDLASRGYVVFAMSHPYDSAGTRLADGTVAEVDASRMATPEQNADLVDIRVADATFVLDQIESLATAAPDSLLIGHLDLNRIGMIGHSLGGATAAEMLADDHRVVAAVNIDGRLFGTPPQLNRPFLWLQNSETADATIRSSKPTGVYGDMADIERGTLSQMTGPGGLLIVEDSRHLDFSDVPSYLGPLGRRLLGKVTNTSGSSLNRTKGLLAGVIDDFMGDGLTRPGSTTLDALADRDPGLSPYEGAS
jgi:predicted dienelactone hydrolase